MHQPSFSWGSPTVFDKPPSVNESTSLRAAMSVTESIASSG